ncbi:hypothetical protein [Caballeronia insecticola]|uniref:Putative transmembrane anti-sigma factor n=1 Tax=Caballeronia insecticola TaxID=758793 RepID=R4X0J3_9BURK|nr:hypothetical protein [Caballeronia insecticola]BAN27700.1 putative transmembrane anti-sigma factor [Caballeronia insecticola]
MNKPLTKRDIQAFAVGNLAQVAEVRLHASRDKRLRLRNALRNILLGVCAALAVSGWCAATHVSAHMLHASAVMALLDASNQSIAHVPPLVSHNPHFVELTPVGLELVATKTRQAGPFAHIDEFDYRNADGETVILLAARAPFASEQPHWSAQRVGDIRLLTWATDGKRYVLAGHAATHGLMRAADALTMTSQRAE